MLSLHELRNEIENHSLTLIDVHSQSTHLWRSPIRGPVPAASVRVLRWPSSKIPIDKLGRVTGSRTVRTDVCRWLIHTVKPYDFLKRHTLVSYMSVDESSLVWNNALHYRAKAQQRVLSMGWKWSVDDACAEDIDCYSSRCYCCCCCGSWGKALIDGTAWWELFSLISASRCSLLSPASRLLGMSITRGVLLLLGPCTVRSVHLC